MSSTCAHCSAELPQGARYCPRCGQASSATAAGESEFHQWRRRVNKRLFVFCALAIPIGLLFLRTSPATTAIVSGLGTLGLIITAVRLSRLAGP